MRGRGATRLMITTGDDLPSASSLDTVSGSSISAIPFARFMSSRYSPVAGSGGGTRAISSPTCTVASPTRSSLANLSQSSTLICAASASPAPR